MVQLKSLLKASGLAALLAAMGACSSLGEGQSQTIYIPTANGVEAQRVSTGPEPVNPAEVEPRSEEPDELRRALTNIATYGNGCGDWVAEVFSVRDETQFYSYLRLEKGSSLRDVWIATYPDALQLECILRDGGGTVEGEAPLAPEGLVESLARVIEGSVKWRNGRAEIELIQQVANSTPVWEPKANYIEQLIIDLFAHERFVYRAQSLCGMTNCRLLKRVCGIPNSNCRGLLPNMSGFATLCRFRRSSRLKDMQGAVE